MINCNESWFLLLTNLINIENKINYTLYILKSGSIENCVIGNCIYFLSYVIAWKLSTVALYI